MERASARDGHVPYPERDDAPEPVVDRLLAGLGFGCHNLFARTARTSALLAETVARHVSHCAGQSLLARIPELRYRLRRGGLQPELIAECFGFYCAALASTGVERPARETFASALLLLQGGIAEMADVTGRQYALGLAATVRAVEGTPVHIVTVSDARAQHMAEGLRGPLAALGIRVGVVKQGMDRRGKREAYSAPVTCGAQREIGTDYLRDRLRLGGRARPLAGRIRRLSGELSAEKEPLLPGLICALVEEADVCMLDEANAPLVIATDVDPTAERLMYEQALELARALARGGDFTVEDDGMRLTQAGARRIERLVGPLGGIWAARQRREMLVAAALKALHQLKAERDYRIEGGRVLFPEARPEETTEDEVPPDPVIKRLVEVKEGCLASPGRDVLARLSVPRFLRRYLHLAGTCGDARGIEREFWSLYSIKTTRVGRTPSRVACAPVVYGTAEAKRAALVHRVRDAVAGSRAALISVRTQTEMQAVAAAFGEAGIHLDLLQGTGDEADRQALNALDRPGAAVLALHFAERNVMSPGARGVPLSLYVAELHDAGRHVHRIARAFAADSCDMLLSLEDDAVVSQVARPVLAAARIGAGTGGALSPVWSRWLTGLAQRGVERAYVLMREELMSRDKRLEDMLTFSGRGE
jgi:preprotein translocase subunit SecA